MTAGVYFADTSFWLGILVGRDAHHGVAVKWRVHVLANRVRLLTTDLIMWELLNAMAASKDRARAAGLYEACVADPSIEVAAYDPADFREAMAMYRTRADKGWGITDCYSFLLMSRRGITRALTADHHFQQAGFEALLLHDPPTT